MDNEHAKGKEVQSLIYDWLRLVHPDGPLWGDADFDCFGNTPIEIKMIPAFDAVEFNIENGGWAQLLWNCFANWRQLVQIAKQGYQMIGAAPQSTALDKLYALCTHDEQECEQARAQASQASDDEASRVFAEFTRRSYGKRGFDWEALFFADSGIHEKRLEWLAANEARVRKAVGALHS
jgi:hypothetical protein